MPSDRSETIMAVAGIMLIVFSLAFVFPAIILAQESPETTTLTVTENEITAVKAPLYIQALNINNNQDTANITVINQDTGDTASTGEITEGDTVSLTLSGSQVNITLDTVLSASKATVVIDYPIYFGWPSEAQTVFSNLPSIIIATAVFIIMFLVYILIGVFSNGD